MTSNSPALLFRRRLCAVALALSTAFAMPGAAWSQAAPAASGAAAPAAGTQPAAPQTAEPDLDMVSALSNIPAPTLGAKAWLTLYATSGQIIAAQIPQEAIEPASLT
jgi:D-alanyl-D-alanine carboxypeptidase (penicillin-binding protein 5/6)